MAGTSIVVDLLLKARDLASAPIRGIVASIKFLDSEISVVAGKIRDAFSTAFGGGLDGAIEFEAQLSKVAAKGGFTAAEMEKLKQVATDIGPDLGATGTEAAQGMEALAAAGLNATQVMQALPPVLALAKAEGISMDAAAEKLSDSLATVGLGFDQAARMADVLAKGANLSTTSASALADALATAGGIAKTAGLNLEQTVAALSELANAGIKGEKAGTALQAILTQLINPASQASKELSVLGITSRDLGTVIDQLAARGKDGNAAILAFGETAGPGLRALVAKGSQALADLTGQLGNSTGAAQAAATGINDNLKGALAALGAAWANVKTALFEPVLQPLAQAARDTAEVLKTRLASGALAPVQEAIRTFAATGIQAARDFIAGFDFKAALTALQDLATGAKETFGGIRDAGVQAASVVRIAWNSFTAGMKTIGASLLAVAASAVSNVAAIEEAASKIGLGSLARANELRATATELAAKASELTQSIAHDGEDIRNAFGALTGTADDSARALERVADGQQRIQEGGLAAELTTITRALADYRAMAERADAAAQRSKADLEAGRISVADYGRALLDAADAQAELAAAITKTAAAPDSQQAAASTYALGAALDKLGVDANLMRDRITGGGQDIITTFRSITQNANATGAQVRAAFEKAIESAKTEAEARNIIAAYREWGTTAGRAGVQVTAALDATASRLKTHNQLIFTALDYEQKIAAVRNKNLNAAERDAQAAHDAELLLAKATLARFDLGDKATEAEIKANQELRQGLIQRAEALAGQVQNEEQAVALLEQLRGESVKLLKDTAEQADITAKIAADDQPARKSLAGLVEWGNSQRVVIPVTFSGSGGGSQGAGLIDELNRRAGAQ